MAVSGGVDSVVLLDVLASKFNTQNSVFQFIVAHFDHGIRVGSEGDRLFVEKLASKYGLKFEYRREELGKNASEEIARIRRYVFLRDVAGRYGAKKIITAHHKDDSVETAVFNILRGTGWRGVVSLRSGGDILRPFLGFSKERLLDYARNHKLDWSEDETNQSGRYTRNRIRKFLETLSETEKQKIDEVLSGLIGAANELEALSEEVFEHGFNESSNSFDRGFFISLPYKVSCEILVHWLRLANGTYDKKLINLLAVKLKTLKHGSKVDINKNLFFEISGELISLKSRSPV